MTQSLYPHLYSRAWTLLLLLPFCLFPSFAARAQSVAGGKSPQTTLVSVNSAGTDSGNSFSGSSVISADGRTVAFVSFASDLVTNDTNGTLDVFVRDLKTGTTTLASVNRMGTDSGNNFSDLPVLSADGRAVAFESFASDLVANDTNGTLDVFARPIR